MPFISFLEKEELENRMKSKNENSNSEKTVLDKKEDSRLKEHEQILIEMRKEISALGYTVSQHQSYFELLQKLSEQQKIEVVKN